MLLTTCPNCAAQFKVQPEQLNIRQGRVMCGRCREVFNAFQSLTRIEDAPADDAVDTAVAEELERGTAPEMDETVVDQIFLRSEPEPLSADFHDTAEQKLESPALVEPVEPTSPMEYSQLPEPQPFLDQASDFEKHGESDATMSARLVDTEIPGEPSDPPTNPLMANKWNAKAQVTPTRNAPWILGSILLVLALSAEIAFAFKSTLVQSVPESQSHFLKLCAWMECRISWGNDETAIKVESSDLVETPTKPGRILFTATLANRGKTIQDLPYIEVKLTDNANQTLASRTLSPADYLGRPLRLGEAMAANSEVFVNLNIDVGAKTLASGYAVRAFYP